MSKPISFFASITLLACISIVSGQENIVVNGSFEEPPVDVSELFDTTTQGIAGWQIASGSVDLNSTRWDPFHLDQSIDLVGLSLGTIEQVLETEAGSSYAISFAFANNPEIMTGASVFAQIRVTGKDSELFSITVEHAESVATEMNYEQFQSCFIADAENCTLQIRAINSVGARGVVLDDVRIIQYLLGDANLDGEVNLLDVANFVQTLESGGYSLETDINCDGITNLLDVDPFVELLGG